VLKDKGKAPISQPTANKTVPVCVVNLLYLVFRKAHNPVWDDGESRDMVNQNILGFWISTPFPAQLWVCRRTSLPACKAITKGTPAVICCWLVGRPAEQKLFLSLTNQASHALRNLVLKKMLCCWCGARCYLATWPYLCTL